MERWAIKKYSDDLLNNTDANHATFEAFYLLQDAVNAASQIETITEKAATILANVNPEIAQNIETSGNALFIYCERKLDELAQLITEEYGIRYDARTMFNRNLNKTNP